MKKYHEATMRGDKIFFYPIGIYGNNTVIKIGKTGMCHVKTLGNLRKQFHEEKVSFASLQLLLVWDTP